MRGGVFSRTAVAEAGVPRGAGLRIRVSRRGLRAGAHAAQARPGPPTSSPALGAHTLQRPQPQQHPPTHAPGPLAAGARGLGWVRAGTGGRGLAGRGDGGVRGAAESQTAPTRGHTGAIGETCRVCPPQKPGLWEMAPTPTPPADICTSFAQATSESPCIGSPRPPGLPAFPQFVTVTPDISMVPEGTECTGSARCSSSSGV